MQSLPPLTPRLSHTLSTRDKNARRAGGRVYEEVSRMSERDAWPAYDCGRASKLPLPA